MLSIIRRQGLRATFASLPQLAARNATPVPRLTQVMRSYTATATATASTTAAPLKSNISTSSSALVSTTKDLVISGNRIIAGAVLSRQPLILRDVTPFEQEYFAYQKSLERDNAAPFGAEFYFKKGSVAERRWKQQEAERLSTTTTASTAPSSSSKGNATGKAASSLSSSSSQGAAAADEELSEEDRVAALENKVAFNDRVTDADRENNVHSLERALARTLYLIVKKPRELHAWQFPQGGVHVCENLQEAAGRELQEECGANMDLWFVGRVPIGHYNYKFPKAARDATSEGPTGAKVFFMKAHIFSGQVKVDNKEIVDFAWVTKQEMKDYVAPEYYEAVKDMLSDF